MWASSDNDKRLEEREEERGIEKIEETRMFSSTLPKFSLSASGVELTDSKKTIATLQVENAMLQLKQSRLQAEMNEMMLFYEEDNDQHKYRTSLT